jgi:hypothetical protein
MDVHNADISVGISSDYAHRRPHRPTKLYPATACVYSRIRYTFSERTTTRFVFFYILSFQYEVFGMFKCSYKKNFHVRT